MSHISLYLVMMISSYLSDIIIIYHVFYFFLVPLHFYTSSTYASSCHRQAFTHSIRLFVFICTTLSFSSVFKLYKKKGDNYMFLPLFLFFSLAFSVSFFYKYLPVPPLPLSSLVGHGWVISHCFVCTYTYELPSRFDLRVFV